ncbi:MULTISPECIES: cache domain-containing protein [unclassified Sulfurospirillum]|uniref:cache domain-containing protein n=1 Tax=unclassified Sulfurospirillum TaxID=2618290 RepID=UPI0025E82ADC|nr:MULTISPECIES: cache domain-containing protein [unclassified Sulfurospirillum]
MAVLISGYIGAVLIHAFPKVNNKVTQLEKINIEEVLNKIVSISEIVYQHLDEFENEAINSRQKMLQNASLLPASVFEDYYAKKTLQDLNENEAKKQVYSKLSGLKYPNNGHFFVINQDANILALSLNKTQKSPSFLNDTAFLLQLTKEAKEKKEAFGRHVDTLETLVYLKWFQPWNLFIGVDEPIDEISHVIEQKKHELFEKLNTIIKSLNRVNVGQSFIFDKQGYVIVTQDTYMLDHNLKTIYNPNTQKNLYDTFTQTAHTSKILHFKWNKPEDTEHYRYEKILWIDYIPKLQWYVATTAYVEELEIMSNKLQKIIASLGIIVLIIALIISYIFFKKLLQPISTLSEMANSATKGDYSVRSSIKSNDEIGELSKNFNTMIETIESNIKKEKQMMEQSRLAQMGEMMSMIAHQWRQPLGAIGSATTFIKIQSEKYHLEKTDDRFLFLSALNKKLASIEEYVHFLSTTIDDFRTFFKQNTEKELVLLTTPVEKALQMIEASLISKNIKVLKHYQCNHPIEVYKNELVQVILNILKNSEDNFVEKNISQPCITISTQKNDHTYTIGIEDNGGGILEEFLPKIFEPYFSTKLEKNGTGLGLYMSKVIIEEHHQGKLNATDVQNGILFEIILYI